MFSVISMGVSLFRFLAALALCDWSNLQQKRRNLARKHCSPRDASSFHQKMSDVGVFEMQEMMDHLGKVNTPDADFHLKPMIMQAAANMFSQYMCSMRFEYEDKEFQKLVRSFDEIFWEINQGYAVDFLPWLAPFYTKHMAKLVGWSGFIREFIMTRIVDQREQSLEVDQPEKDFTDALLKSLRDDPSVERDTIIFMLEDFLGGHSAIGNLVVLALGYIAQNPSIGTKIQAEVDIVTDFGKRNISLNDMDKMPYTVATIFEVLRYSSSPIVPHVATEDAQIAGYGITKDTIVFINNYDLNTSEKYWDEPKKFDPERFLELTSTSPPLEKSQSSDSLDSGIDFDTKLSKSTHAASEAMPTYRVKKNIPHFLPFSIGELTHLRFWKLGIGF
jgi:cytochrome P450 family 307 subfamily A